MNLSSMSCEVCLSSTPAYPGVEEQVDVFVKENLVLLVPRTKVLQELMSQLHDLLHAHILTLEDVVEGIRIRRSCMRPINTT